MIIRSELVVWMACDMIISSQLNTDQIIESKLCGQSDALQLLRRVISFLSLLSIYVVAEWVSMKGTSMAMALLSFACENSWYAGTFGRQTVGGIPPSNPISPLTKHHHSTSTSTHIMDTPLHPHTQTNDNRFSKSRSIVTVNTNNGGRGTSLSTCRDECIQKWGTNSISPHVSDRKWFYAILSYFLIHERGDVTFK